MLKVVVFHPSFGEPSGSPFCVKAMCLLHLSGLEWEPEFIHDPRKAPKGKLPILKDGGQSIADSDAIRDHLEKTYAIEFDSGLSAEDRAVSRALIRMAEEHIYFAILCDRWLIDESWHELKKAFFAHLRFPMSLILPPLVRKGICGQAMGQGSGRHTEVERVARLDADFTAIATLLGEKPFLFGDSPTAADASVAPMLQALAVSPVKTLLGERVRSDARLMAYLERAKERLYPVDTEFTV